MAWLAVCKDGRELIFENKPRKSRGYMEIFDWTDEHSDGEIWWNEYIHYPNTAIEIPKGTIEKIIGEALSYEDGPREINNSN